ncbi:MAG: hypothetical protein WCY82_00535 [Desulfotomaculaceae bacterium]
MPVFFETARGTNFAEVDTHAAIADHQCVKKIKRMEAVRWYPERAVHLTALNRAATQKQD